MRTSVCAIVKNEHRYLEEWIQYHLKVGFDEIWIGEDYGSNSHKSIVDKFDKQKVHLINVTEYVPNHSCQQGKNARQIVFYNKFFQEHKEDFDWIANFDIDEFLVLESETLHEFLSDYKEYEGVCLAWKYYGANGHLTPPEGGVLKNYTKPDYESHCDCQVKSIVNCHLAKKVLFMHAATRECVNVFKQHDFRKSLNGMNYARPKNWHRAWVNHYFTRSWQEWVERMLRGNMRNNFRTLDTFFEYNKDMVDKQKELIFEAMKYSKKFHLTDIYSRKFSLFNPNYSRKLKDNFFKRIGMNCDGMFHSTAHNNNVQHDILDMTKRTDLLMYVRKLLGSGIRCAEIGVLRGQFSKDIQRILNPSYYILIDTWGKHLESFKEYAEYDLNEWMKMYEDVKAEFHECDVVRALSVDAAKHVDDASIDFIYIDADHDRLHEDLEAWMPKLKKGGIIAGHDYAFGNTLAYHIDADLRLFFGNRFNVTNESIKQWYYLNN